MRFVAFLLALCLICEVRGESPLYTRLPDEGIVPMHYDIRLLPWMETKDWLLEGFVGIDIQATRATSTVTLHSRNNIPQEAIRVHDLNNNELDIFVVTFDAATDQLGIWMEEDLVEGNFYRLELTYFFVMTEELEDGHGIFKREYEDANGVMYYVVGTQFEDIGAREAFPCFDEPELKATFSMTLGHRKADYIALANTPVSFSEDMEGEPDWEWSTYLPTEEMSTYLVAVVIAIMDVQTQESVAPTSVYVPPGLLPLSQVALDSGAFILEYFGSSWLDSPYSFDKMDIVPIFNHPAGAMENWGLVQFNPGLFYYDEGVDPIAQAKQVIEVVSHELAHQWFGNLVTMKWWSQLWLNEGITSYYQYVGSDAYDKLGLWYERMPVVGVEPGYRADVSSDARPVSEDIFDETFEFANNNLIYRKGAALNHMLYSCILGQGAFESGHAAYIADMGHGAAQNENYWKALQDAADQSNIDLPRPVSVIMDGYLLQPGVPLVRAIRDYAAGGTETVVLTQERFLLDGDDDGSRYYIPIKYLQGGPTESGVEWLMPSEDLSLTVTFAAETDALVINPGRQSYMVVLYDEENYERIIDTLNGGGTTQFSNVVKGSLFVDTAWVIEKGLVSREVGARMTEYLDFEVSEIAWFGMVRLHSTLMTNPPSPSYEQEFLTHVQTALDYIETLPPPEEGYYDVVIELLESLLSNARENRSSAHFIDSEYWKITSGQKHLEFLCDRLEQRVANLRLSV